MITITIPGQPIPKLRARHTKRGITFDPQSDKKKYVRLYLQSFINERLSDIQFPLKGPVNCEFYFYMPIPASFTNGEKSLISWNALEHVSKPDCDNLEKFYLDCMSGIVYEDDRRIYRMSTLKRYDPEPRTEIRIMIPEKSILDKAKSILSLFPSDELADFAEDLSIIADCLDVEFLNQKEECKEKLQLEAAYALSILADRYGAILNQITKKYPGIWKNISEFEEKNYKEVSVTETNAIPRCYTCACEGLNGKR